MKRILQTLLFYVIQHTAAEETDSEGYSEGGYELPKDFTVAALTQVAGPSVSLLLARFKGVQKKNTSTTKKYITAAKLRGTNNSRLSTD